MGKAGRTLDVGIIGAGGAGLTAAWLLGDTHAVTLYEKQSRLGGHVDSAEIELAGERVTIDAGVDFFWPRMYPTFSSLLRALDVPVHRYAATLTLYSADGRRVYRMPPIRGGKLHWSTFTPRQLSTMLTFRRLLRRATQLVASGDTSTTVEQFVEGEGGSRSFKDDFFYPLMLAGWCMDGDEFRRFAAYDPLKYAVMREPGRFGLTYAREVVGGARVYIDTLAKALTGVRIKASSAIQQITRPGGRYVLRDADGEARAFDHLIVATGAHEARDLLTHLDGTEELRRELARFEYFKTLIAIHGDRRLMPADEEDWSVINIRHDGAHSLNTVWKPWASRAAIFKSWVTFETRRPDPLYRLTTYDHPKVSPAYFEAQRAIGKLQGRNNLWLAGMYTHDADCHESAVISAVNVARRLAPASERLGRLAGSGGAERAASPQVPGTQR